MIIALASPYPSPVRVLRRELARMPVVAAGVGGISELAGGAATLVSSFGPSTLPDAIVSVLSGGESSDEMVREGYQRAPRQRTEKVVAAHRRLYDVLLNR